jgi:sigma-B regulation protein RsbU (phosphoserine phosphatase)
VSVIRDWLTGTLAGRALLIGTSIKSVTLTLAAFTGPLSGTAAALDTIGGIAILIGAAILIYRLSIIAKRRLLWRVRRKLTLSYIFIGVVPALLIIAFFLLSGLLLFFNVSSYLVQSRLRALVDQTQFLAQTAALELQRSADATAFEETLERRQAGASARYPNASYAVLPVEKMCGESEARGFTPSLRMPIQAGPWPHLSPPASLPEWITCDGYAGLIVYGAQTRLVARAVAFPGVTMPRYAVIVDVPLGPEVARQLREETGIELGAVTALNVDEARTNPENPNPDLPDLIPSAGFDATVAAHAGILDRPREWVAFLDDTDWDTGSAGTATIAIRTSISGIYDRISATPVTRIGNFNFGQILLILLGVVAGLFLVIQIVAFGMGLALARSITGSVHALFAGTERVREGDFTHKIVIPRRDQLGELAESFNSMTASIEDLLQQKAEKERLEQELRIARTIQMSLLPQGPLRMPGLSLAGHCEPAREVGGDYYDFLPIDDQRLGILIADVAGKGASAALYMAELKGVVLALSQAHRSPRQLLIAANRVISQHISTRSFITITYAVVDLETRTLTHARAGHCPLMYLPGDSGGPRQVRALAPDGLVLGLKIDNGERFESLLEEMTLPLGAGDLFVLYTDGISEAMNAEGDCFGDTRLGAIIEDHANLPFEELRERILREIAAFVGSAPQQDDMTMLLLKIDDAVRPEGRPLHSDAGVRL